MSKERYNQIIDEVYKIYVMLPKELSDVISDNEKFNGRNFTQEEFINKCKTDSEFSEKWVLKIEERVLSLEERLELWYQKNKSETGKRGIWEIDYIEKYEGHKKLNSYNIPTKLITITYKGTIIESYE